MNLNAVAAEKRRAVFDRLRAGQAPEEGSFDPALFAEAKSKGQPQMGSTRYTPDSMVFEFIYPNPNGAPIVLPVALPSPERIVFLPVPAWVVESIWQGEIDGSFQFESEARRMLSEFQARLEPEANAPLFGPKAASRRE